MEEKKFMTYKDQLARLKERNLVFHSEEGALNALQRFGYYNIINGYKEPYITTNKAGDEVYKDGVSFEQVFSLYNLDRDVRNAILNCTLEVEDMLRAAIAHTIAESFTEKESMYLNPKNYRSGKKRPSGFQRDDILRKFNKILTSNEQSILHYKTQYGNVPPWIMLKGASFGNLVNFLKLLKAPEKNRALSIFSGLPVATIATVNDIKDLLMDTLFVCLDYRNRAAHGWRVYNYCSRSKFRYSNTLHQSILKISKSSYDNAGFGKTGLPILYAALGILQNYSPSISLSVGIKVSLDNHYETYPQDRQLLDEFLDLESYVEN